MYSTAALQNLCLFKVVQELEYYPPEFLVCLPPTLRRLLLVHLPVIDVCQLANTCVFDGINTETIWEQLYHQHTPRYFVSDEIFPLCNVGKTTIEKTHTSFRERYLAILATIVLNRARPTGYFGARNIALYFRSRGVCFNIRPPPPSFLSVAPVDIVNTLIAGEKITTVHVLEAEDEAETSDGDDTQSVSDTCIFSLIEEGDACITAVTDYYKSNVYALNQNHCALVEDREWGHDHDDEYTECISDYCAYKDTNERCQYIPLRYSSYALYENDYRLSDEDAITLLMGECQYYPEFLSLSILAFNSKHWVPDLLSQFVCHVVTLKLFFDGHFECYTEEDVPHEQILTAVLSNDSPLLSSLELDSDTDNQYCLSYDEDEYESAYVTDDHLSLLAQLSESPPTLPSLASPLCTLRELSVSGVFTADGLTKLGTVISGQKILASLSLHSLNVELHGYSRNTSLADGCICSRPFVDALISLFQSPCFESVTLKCVTIDHILLQDLVAGFLTSSCTHPQKLMLESIEIESDGSSKTYESSECQLRVSHFASEYKSLEFSVKEHETSTCNVLHFFRWFFSLQLLKLNSLKHFCWSKHVHVDCLPVLVKNTSFHVKNLSLCQSTDISAEAIQNLLRNDTLKSLELKFCSGMIGLQQIAEYILKPLSRSTLEELKIVEGIRTDKNFYAQPFSKESISLFSDTLFSLPHLNQFTLEISVLRYNQIYRHIVEFVEILHESWKKNGGRKLKRFLLYASKGTLYILEGHRDQETVLQMANEIGLLLKNEADVATC